MLERRLVVVLVVVLGVGAIPSPALAGAAGQADCSFPYSTVDATGTEVTIDAEPERIVSLAPSAAQTLWEIGARGTVVGLSTYATYLEGAGNRTVVSDAQGSVVIEAVVALSPDLVLAPNVISNDTVTRLRGAGLVVVRFGPARTIQDVYAKTERIGRLVGACAGADRTVGWMRDRLDPVREAARDADRPGALYVFFGFTASRGTFVHEMIEVAGGTNVAASAGLPPGYHRLSREVVANRSDEIDWIVLNSDDPSPPRTAAYNETRALRKGNVVVLDANLLSQPAPRIVYPITRLVEAFHPEAYAAANASSTPTESPTPPTPPTTTTPSPTASATPTPEDSPTATTATPGQSGFEPLLVLFALAMAIAVARARP